MPFRLWLLPAVLLSATLWLPAADLDPRMQHVEQGLLPATAAKGQPAPRMTLASRLRFYHVPGVSVAVIDEGKVAWARGYGLTAATGGRPVTAETLFQAASISKPVAAMVALHLVDEGKLSLDEDVNLKLRSWKVPDNASTKVEKVTLRRLLSHSAGITVHGFVGYAAGQPVPALLQVLDGRKPANSAPVRVDTVPGNLWRYSGGGYEIVQQLIMDVTGKSFPHVAWEFVLGPLSMNQSMFEQPLPSRYDGTAATGHRADGTMLPGRWHTYPEMAAAGLWTTPSDLARVVLELQTGGHVLKPETRKLMLTRQADQYGLGLRVGDTAFAHDGANEGFRCTMFAYLEGGRGTVVMTNGDGGDPLAAEILRSIAAEYGWPDYKVAVRP